MTTEDAASGIVVEGVSRAFGEVKAVRFARFTASPGTVTGLIGPNGSGKTTLMLMLASLLKPDAGHISIAGFDPVTDTEAVRSRLGWMPDVLGSWSALTVRSTLEYTGRLYRLDRTTAARRAGELIVLVGLESLADSPTRVLSRGQKQKLSLARALVHDPAVLLLDEPASGLDPAARVDLRKLVRRVANEGKTVLVSSHVLAELDEMADGAVYLANGVTASDESVAIARSSARSWRIKSAEPAALLTALETAGFAAGFAAGSAAGSAGVSAGVIVAEDRGEVTVPFESEAEASEVLAKLVAAGVPISAFAPAVGDLEQTFLELNSVRETENGGDA